MSASQLLHAHAGAPEAKGCTVLDADVRCWLCAAKASRGMLATKWQGVNFTDQNKGRAFGSPWVCEACVWVCSWVPPPGSPPTPPGKKGLNLRLFSHLYDAGDYCFANKASKPEIRDWLRTAADGGRSGTWFAAIADSGQKHTLPWTPVNPGSHAVPRVWFEERAVVLGDFSLVDAMIVLLDAGATKAEIATGDYKHYSWKKCPSEIFVYERAWGRRHRGSSWFDLALWLAQRTETP